MSEAVLTDQQQRVYDYLVAFLMLNDTLPTSYKVAEAFGHKSASGATEMFLKLYDKGYLEKNEIGGYMFARSRPHPCRGALITNALARTTAGETTNLKETMNTRANRLIPAIGAAMEGGFFHGILLLNGQIWGEVTATQEDGEVIDTAWHPKYIEVPKAVQDFDGLANTNAMAEAGSPLAQLLREKRIGGHDDWYMPARGGQLLQWAARDSLPGAARFEPSWYWSSTQYSRDGAFGQHFGYGDTDDLGKSWESGRARAVRRFLIE